LKVEQPRQEGNKGANKLGAGAGFQRVDDDFFFHHQSFDKKQDLNFKAIEWDEKSILCP